MLHENNVQKQFGWKKRETREREMSVDGGHKMKAASGMNEMTESDCSKCMEENNESENDVFFGV